MVDFSLDEVTVETSRSYSNSIDLVLRGSLTTEDDVIATLTHEDALALAQQIIEQCQTNN